MFVVTVRFRIRAGQEDDFHAAVLDQARNSLRREPECQQFDVCRNPEDAGDVFLYEVYTNAAAFESHQQTEHFAGFGARVGDLVEEKSVRIWERVGAARGA
ncbi:MAG: antibiotic biosynthesis monooxygenase [Acidobacteria bacterium]|jgi:autoinducer 2-degrading protein|nr:antibiotic biosynthesis monooxygenase [Acidobacteriota bacterium]